MSKEDKYRAKERETASRVRHQPRCAEGLRSYASVDSRGQLHEDEETTEETGMVDSDCQGELLKAQDAAVELYQLAALMLGDESQAIELVEATVAQTNIDPCTEVEASVQAARIRLVRTAIARLSQADPGSFDAPVVSGEARGGCIEDDDLSSVEVSASQIAGMISGPGRRTLRDWLNKLPVAQRAVFVERAILGWDNAAAAASLSDAASRSWQPNQVSDLFRQALCSLASSLVHATTARA
jgi:DNA-directed RNA polymerase specialized sigma24 family protein